MDRKVIVAKVMQKFSSRIEKNKIDDSKWVEISEKEALRLKGEGVSVPGFEPEEGNIYDGSKEVGRVDKYEGIMITDKDFAKKKVKDVLRYLK